MRHMIIEVLTLVLSLLSVIGAIIAIWLAINAKIDVEAMKRSTHSVQLVPVDKLTDVPTDTDEAMRSIHRDEKHAPMLDLVDDAF